MKYLKTLRRKHLKDKTAIVRVDFNIASTKQHFRIDASLPTIQFLTKKRARVVLVSHRGRPKRTDSKQSLKIVLPYLRRKLKRQVTFISGSDFKSVARKIARSRPGSVFLLENLRFNQGEDKNSKRFAEQLAGLGEIYVNDAFAVSHRKTASIWTLPRLLPAYAGLLLEKELQNLDRVKKTKKRPLVVVLGGAKVSDKLGVINHLMPHTAHFLIGGLAANTFLKAAGYDIKRSGYQPKMLSVAKKLLKSKKIILPMDFLESEKKILDIGPMSVAIFSDHIKKAKTVFWNGPMGYFEKTQFARGTEGIARAVAKARGFSVVGGGETTQLVYEKNLQKKVNFVSTGGGAMLAYISGKTLPGIAALRASKKKI